MLSLIVVFAIIILVMCWAIDSASRSDPHGSDYYAAIREEVLVHLNNLGAKSRGITLDELCRLMPHRLSSDIGYALKYLGACNRVRKIERWFNRPPLYLAVPQRRSTS